MENKPIYSKSLRIRIINIIELFVFLFFGILLTILAINYLISPQEDFDIAAIIGPFIFLIFLTIISYFLIKNIFLRYSFTKEKIIKKTLFKTSETVINDIIGYVYYKGLRGKGSESKEYIYIYTKEKKLSIQLSYEKIINIVNSFESENREKIKEKNMHELENTGILIKINKKREIHFYRDHVKVTINGNTEEHNYSDLTLKHSYIDAGSLYANYQSQFTMVTKNNKKIKLDFFELRGRFGLIEYLIGLK